MISPFVAALFALAAAASWGAGDFAGGLSTRRSDAFRSVFLAFIIGLAALLVVLLVSREPLAAPADLAWGVVSGLAGMIGVGFLYRGLAAGRMGIVAPVSAVLATAIPVIFSAFVEGLPRLVQLAGFAAALAGIWLLSRPERLSGRPAGLGLAVLAGLGFGIFFTTLGQISEQAVFWPLVAGRAACVAVMALFALVTRRQIVRHTPWGLVTLTGILDVTGNLFFLLGAQYGRLDVTAVLASLYPAVTALLAWLAIKEHLTRFQMVGMSLALLAIVLITV